MSIFLEAVQRLFEPQEVKKPEMVMVVGCAGLVSNIVGLLLFHEHSHGPGGHAHEHAHGAEADLEDGHAYEQTTQKMADERNTVASIMPENVIGVHRADEPDVGERPQIIGTGESAPGSPSTPRRNRHQETSANRRSRGYSTSKQRGFGGLEEIQVHPAERYQTILTAGQSDSESTAESDAAQDEEGPVTEQTSLLGGKDRQKLSYTNGHDHKASKAPQDDSHRHHNHAQPQPDKKGHGHGHGHSHGDLNMKGVFLHVLGDALGNIGVITSALIIWLTDYSWRYYVDPGISLIITIIILCSALPLCKAASRILLQAVPTGMSIDHIQEDINSIRGVVSSHHLHVWQLSDTKLVASIHVQVGSEIKDEGSDSYMKLAKEMRRCLHAYGIHSSTIQPEFITTDLEFFGQQQPAPSNANGSDSNNNKNNQSSSSASSVLEGSACLLECGDECPDKQCCPTK
jgi:zinc transporter 1